MTLSQKDLEVIAQLQQKSNPVTLNWKHVASFTFLSLSVLGGSIYTNLIEDIKQQEEDTKEINKQLDEFHIFRNDLNNLVQTVTDIDNKLQDPRFTEQNFLDRYWPTVLRNEKSVTEFDEFMLESKNNHLRLQESLRRIETKLDDTKGIR